ncbi:ATP-binding protein [Limosilactobacillus reuteri]
MSTLGSSDIIGSFIIDIISEYLFETKTVENKGFFIYIDEAHRYLRDKDTLAMGLENIAREGRKKGIFLFLTSQSPKDVPDTIVSQIGSVIVHRLTSEEDIYTLRNYLSKDAIAKINSLNKGEAILSSINLLENLFLKFNKSTLPHSNNTQLL